MSSDFADLENDGVDQIQLINSQSMDDYDSSELGMQLFPTPREYSSKIQGVLMKLNEHGLLKTMACRAANHNP